MNDRVNTPPRREQMTQRNGQPSIAWAKFFEQVFQATRNLNGQTLQAAKLSFIGRSTDGAVTASSNTNVATMLRNGVGRYDGTLTQPTVYGSNILSDCVGYVSLSLSSSSNTQAFQADFLVTGDSTFTVNIYELVQGSGVSIDRQLYDPDESGDQVTVTILSTLAEPRWPT